jgi:ubiquinone/menaquinone biosynthesis C-methylase UbiE
MKNKKKADFDKRAPTWDEKPSRVKFANGVADMIIREIGPTEDMDAMDYGCGTGLVTLRLQPLVKSIIGLDSSKGMLEVIREKVKTLGLENVRTQLLDFDEGEKIEGRFHLIVSSMTLHHIREPAVLLRQFYDLLLPGGYLAITDLDTEDGSFHEDNTGIFHFGFERAYLKGLFEKAGLREVRDLTAGKMTKTIEGKGEREFSVFLIIGRK